MKKIAWILAIILICALVVPASAEDTITMEETGNIDGSGSIGVGETEDGTGDKDAEQPEEVEELDPQYITFTGEIEDVDVIDYGTSERFSVLVNSGDTLMKFHLTDDVLLFESGSMKKLAPEDFEIGQTISAFYHKLTPMAMSYPAQLSPEALILLNEDAGAVKVDVFDSDGRSSDGELVIHLSDSTTITDYLGNELDAENVPGKTLLVFFKTATFSIPPQTTPEFIVVMKSREQREAEALMSTLDDEQKIELEGVTYVRLRDIAETMGFEIEWNPDTQTALLSRLPVSFTITIGELEYGYNRSLRSFEKAPFISGDRTFVEASFVEMLVSEQI